MSTSNKTKQGVNFTPAYQLSAIPFVTSSAQSEVNGIDGNGASPEPIRVDFPNVTKYLKISNTGPNPLRVGFSVRGLFGPGERLPTSLGGAAKTAVSATDNRNYFVIPSTGSAALGSGASLANIQEFDLRCKSIYFMSDAEDNSPTDAAFSTSFSIFAGLTPVDSSEMPILTGSNGFKGIG